MIAEKLKSGDEVRIVAPARSMKILGEDCISIAKERLESLGLKVTFGKHVLEFDQDTMSTDAKIRAEDLNEAFADKNVKAILTVIGGFNSNQILKLLDYEMIKNNPKIFCGFSDITALSNAIYAKTGINTYYGPHFSSFGMKNGFEYTFEYFKKMILENNEIEIKSSSKWSDDAWFIDQDNREFVDNDGMFVINEGEATGKIIGGNLCTFNLLQGTEFRPKFDEDTILFLEDDEMAGALFNVEFDRNLVSIIQQEDFENVKGIVIGRAQKNSVMNKEKWFKIIKSKSELENIPVIAGCDFGHTTPIITFPIGGKCSLKAIKDDLKLIISD